MIISRFIPLSRFLLWLPAKSPELTTYAFSQIEIPRVTFSKAILDKQLDGTLRWMVFNRFGYQEYRIFADENRLDHYLSQNEHVDIWEVQVENTTLYKWCDPDETISCTCQEELYRELALTTDHGVFSIYDVNTHKERFVQQKRGWFRCGFEEVSLEQAKKTLLRRMATQVSTDKILALGIATLAASSVVVVIGKTLSNKVWDLTKEGRGLFTSPTLYTSLQKTSFLFSVALSSYGRENTPLPMILPSLLGIFISIGDTMALPLCPSLVGSYDTPNAAWSVALSGNYAYVVDVSSLQILDVSNVTKPMFVGSGFWGGQSWDIAVDANYAYLAVGNSGLQIIDVSNVSNPVLVGLWNGRSGPTSVAISGNYAYVTNDVSGLHIIDVSN
nr:hypothetical protein [Chlamydiota bacterium]